MKRILPVIGLACAITAFAAPALACDRHQTHTAMQTVEAVPAPPPEPTIVIEPAAQSNPASEIQAEAPFSQPLGAVYGNCNHRRKDTTVYLTQ